MGPIVLLSTTGIIGIVFGIIGFLLVCGLIFLISVFVRRKNYMKSIDTYKNMYQRIESIFNNDCATSLTRLNYLSTHSGKFHDSYNECLVYKENIERDEKVKAGQVMSAIDSLKSMSSLNSIRAELSECNTVLQNYDKAVTDFRNALNKILGTDNAYHNKIVSIKDKLHSFKDFVAKNETEMKPILPVLEKCFRGMDESFAQYDVDVDKADYPTADQMYNNLKMVIDALDKYGRELPTVIPYATDVLPKRFIFIYQKYKVYESQGIPLYHLNVDSILKQMVLEDETVRENFYKLDIAFAKKTLDKMSDKCTELENAFEKEKLSKEIFVKKSQNYSDKVHQIQTDFTKLSNSLPENQKKFVLQESYLKSYAELPTKIEDIVKLKSELDSFINASLAQPYTILLGKVDDLDKRYNHILSEIRNIVIYLNKLNNDLIVYSDGLRSLYTDLMIQSSKIYHFNVPSYTLYTDKTVKTLTEELLALDKVLQAHPIDMEQAGKRYVEVKTEVEAFLKESSEDMKEGEDVENLLIYANLYRLDYPSLKETLTVVEKVYFKDHDFKKAYNLVRPLMDAQNSLNEANQAQDQDTDLEN